MEEKLILEEVETGFLEQNRNVIRKSNLMLNGINFSTCEHYENIFTRLLLKKNYLHSMMYCNQTTSVIMQST